MFNRKFDILLTVCPPWGINNPPVGIAYLSSYLKSQGFSVKVVDLNMEVYNKISQEFKFLWNLGNAFYWKDERLFNKLKFNLADQVNECVDKLLEIDVDVIGFSTMDPNERFTMEVIKQLKNRRPDIKIILGGTACWSKNSRNIFSDIFDLIDGFAINEGEYVLKDVLSRFKNGQDLKDTPGLLLPKCNSSYKHRAPIEELDYIPFPTYSEFNLMDYHGGSLVLLWSRGCMGNCVYCKEKSLWGNSKFRTPYHIVKEIEYHVHKNEIKNFVVHDAAINWRPEWVEEICDLIINSGLRINWSAQAVPNFLSIDLLKKLKTAGCHTLIYGIESGSDKVLKRMKKSFTVKKAEETIRRTHREGIQTAINFMVGFPGEGIHELGETVEFLKRNSNYIDRIDGLSSLQVVIDTDIHNNPSKFGIILPPKDEHNKWYTKDGNDFNQRLKRLAAIDRAAKELEIPIQRNFLYEEAGGSRKKIDLEKEQTLNYLKTSMRILMVHPHDIFHYSEPWTVRITNLAKQFVNKGHKVKLIYFPLDPSRARYGIQPEGFEIIPLCRSCGPRNLINNTFKIYKMLDWADIVHFQKCFYYASIPVLLASYLKNKPIHYDWDDWETKIFYYGIVQFYRRPIGIFMHLLERLIPKLVDTISVSSQKLAELAISWGVSKSHIFKAPVGAELEKFNPFISGDDIRQKFKINNLLVLYLGQLHGGQYAELFIQAAKQILDRNVRATFMVVGGGYRFRELKEISRNLGISRDIIFTNFIEHREVPYYIAAADICVACFEDNDITRCKSPLKTVEYLASGKAIVASNVGEVRNMVGGVGILVKPGDSDALAEAIMKVLQDEKLREEMGERARKRAERKYNWGNTADSLLKAYQMVVGKY